MALTHVYCNSAVPSKNNCCGCLWCSQHAALMEVTADARIAAGNGDLSTVEAWLSQGGDINSDGNDLGRSSTLLAAAIVGSQTQICEYLLARGARCGKSDVYCLLEEILEGPSLDVARLLIEMELTRRWAAAMRVGAHPISWRSS